MRPRRDDQREDIAAADAAEAPATDEVPATERIEIVSGEPPREHPVAAEAETIALDPWSARYGLETASLAPFAGEPLSPEAGQPEPPAEPERETERGADHEAPEAGSPEQAAMPLAEAEEGVPFVSGAERELETEQAGEHAASQWREPARPDSEIAPEHPAEHPAGYGTGGSESGEAAPPPGRRAGTRRASARIAGLRRSGTGRAWRNG